MTNEIGIAVYILTMLFAVNGLVMLGQIQAARRQEAAAQRIARLLMHKQLKRTGLRRS